MFPHSILLSEVSKLTNFYPVWYEQSCLGNGANDFLVWGCCLLREHFFLTTVYKELSPFHCPLLYYCLSLHVYNLWLPVYFFIILFLWSLSNPWGLCLIQSSIHCSTWNRLWHIVGAPFTELKTTGILNWLLANPVKALIDCLLHLYRKANNESGFSLINGHIYHTFILTSVCQAYPSAHQQWNWWLPK